MQISRTPRLYVADDFLSLAECAWILANASDPTYLASRAAASQQNATGFSFEMPVAGDTVVEQIQHRLHEAMGFAGSYVETMRFRRYGPGEEHPPHLDCYRIGESCLILTALLFLNDVAAGGETSFARAVPLPIIVKPKRGRLVAWFNHLPEGNEDPHSWHEGSRIRAGVKFTLTQFFYGPPSASANEPVW